LAKGIKRLWDLGNGALTLWGIVPSPWQAVIIAMLGSVTGWAGYRIGLFAGILGGLGAVVLCLMALYYRTLLVQQNTVFERILVKNIGFASISFGDDLKNNPEISAITFKVDFSNDSQRLIFYRIRRANCSLAGKVNQDADINPSYVGILPIGSPQGIMLATIHDVKLPHNGGTGPQGKLELEIEYGSTRDKLDCLFRYVAEPQLGLWVEIEPTPQVRQCMLVAPIKELAHERI
jgi:hypothetical protein